MEKEEYAIEGDHYIADLWECEKEILNNPKKIKKILKNAAIISGANPIKYQDFKFTPNGVTGVWILSESHISIHTYPDNFYAHIDIFTCGSKCNPEKGINEIINKLYSKKNKITYIKRGEACE